MKKTLSIIASLILFIEGFWLIAVPENLILHLIENNITNGDFYPKAEGFKKGLFFDCNAEKVTVFKKTVPQVTRVYQADNIDSNLLTLEDVHIRLNLISLLKLKPVLNLGFIVNGGKVAGEAVLTGNDIKINGSDIRINGIPFFEQIGILGEGAISVSLVINHGKGNIQFSAGKVRLKNISFGGVLLPLELFQNLKGAVTINSDTIEVQSFTLEGNGIYARVKGNIKKDASNMTMELMVNSSFKSEAFPLWTLEQYRVSPGYYAIPLKTSMTH